MKDFALSILSNRKYYSSSIKGGERFEIGDRIRVEINPDKTRITFIVPDDRRVCKYEGLLLEETEGDD